MSTSRKGALAPASVRCGLVAACLALAVPSIAQAALTVEPHTELTGLTGPPVVRAIGDVNGDGRDDVFASDCTRTAIVFGAAAKTSVSVDAPGARGIKLNNMPGCVLSAVGLGDVNGDGLNDVGVSSQVGPFSPATRDLNVVFGRRTAATLDMQALGSAGLSLVKPDGGWSGSGIAKVGDVNGDGLADIGVSSGALDPAEESGLAGVLGVVFGKRGASGDVPFTQSLVGLRVGSTATPSPCCGVIDGIGDVNADGKADIVVNVEGSFGERHIVYGRATAGAVNVDALGSGGQALGTAFDLPGLSNIAGPGIGDLNGDGVGELGSGNAIALSSRTGELFSTSRLLELTATGGGAVSYAQAARDLNGDSFGELTALAHYHQIRGSWIDDGPAPLALTYLVLGAATPRKIDLRVNTAAALRLDAVRDFSRLEGGLRFTGAGGQLLGVTGGAAPKATVYDIVDRPAVADKTPPALTGVSLGSNTLWRSLPFGPKSTVIRYSVSERSYMELTIKRGSTVVTTSTGSVAPGTDTWTLHVGTSRLLQAGAYTATVKATDLAGNAAPVRTVSFTVI